MLGAGMLGAATSEIPVAGVAAVGAGLSPARSFLYRRESRLPRPAAALAAGAALGAGAGAGLCVSCACATCVWATWGTSSSSNSSAVRGSEVNEVGTCGWGCAAGRVCSTKAAISASTPAPLSMSALNMAPDRSSPFQSGGGASTGVEGGSSSPLMMRDRYCRMSCSTTMPPSPVPRRFCHSMPFASARILASGVMRSIPFPLALLNCSYCKANRTCPDCARAALGRGGSCALSLPRPP